MEKVKGKVILRITGVLLIIAGIVSIILGIFMVLSGGMLIGGGSSLGLDENTTAKASVLFILLAGVLIVTGVIELVAGVLGLAKAKTPNSAKPCIVFGIIIILLSLGSAIFSLASHQELISVITSSLIGLVVPIVYMIGASLNLRN